MKELSDMTFNDLQETVHGLDRALSQELTENGRLRRELSGKHDALYKANAVKEKFRLERNEARSMHKEVVDNFWQCTMKLADIRKECDVAIECSKAAHERAMDNAAMVDRVNVQAAASQWALREIVRRLNSVHYCSPSDTAYLVSILRDLDVLVREGFTQNLSASEMDPHNTAADRPQHNAPTGTVTAEKGIQAGTYHFWLGAKG